MMTKVVKEIEKLDLSQELYEKSLVRFIEAIKDESFQFNYAEQWGIKEGSNLKAFFNVYLEKIVEVDKKQKSVMVNNVSS